MHCNLRLPDVVLVVLDFDLLGPYTTAYKFNTSATFLGFGDPNLPSGTDMLAIDWYLRVL